MRKIKTINSHSGLARWLAECSQEPVGYLPTCDCLDDAGRPIPSPYAYSPSRSVYDWTGGKWIIWFETRHKHYEVYAIGDLKPYETDEEATDRHIASLKR